MVGGRGAGRVSGGVVGRVAVREVVRVSETGWVWELEGFVGERQEGMVGRELGRVGG